MSDRLIGVELGELTPGDIFRDSAGKAYILLDHLDDNCGAVLTKTAVANKAFGEDSNWKTSDIRKWLNSEYLEYIRREFGSASVLIHETDMFSLDGTDDYGTCMDYVGLLSFDQYRAYREEIGSIINAFWWILTPITTLKGAYDNQINFVTPFGAVRSDDVSHKDISIRPYFVMSLDTVVIKEGSK